MIDIPLWLVCFVVGFVFAFVIGFAVMFRLHEKQVRKAWGLPSKKGGKWPVSRAKALGATWHESDEKNL